MTTFIGVDLAWQGDRHPTEVAVLAGDGSGASLHALSNRLFGSAVLDFIIEHATEDTVVAIDAPLIIRNQTGQRPCERLIGKRFGKYKASAHSSNLTLYPEAGSVRLASELKERGFAHDVSPQSDRQRPGRWFFEVYPHPAQVVLFGLSERILYKKGNVGQKRHVCVVAGLGSQLSSWVLWRVGLTNSWRDLKQKLPSGSLRDFSGVAECFSIPSDTRYRFTLRDGRIVDAPEPFSSTTGKKAEALKKVWRKCGGGELSFMPEKPHP